MDKIKKRFRRGLVELIKSVACLTVSATLFMFILPNVPPTVPAFFSLVGVLVGLVTGARGAYGLVDVCLAV